MTILTKLSNLHFSSKEKNIFNKKVFSVLCYVLRLPYIKITKKSNFPPLPRNLEFVKFLPAVALKIFEIVDLLLSPCHHQSPLMTVLPF